MLRPLVLRNPVGPAHSVEPRDTRAIKRSLDRLGLYRPPADEITDVADGGMFAGLKAFQRRRGLPADGVAEPGGPTEAALNEALLSAAKERETSARRETRTRASFTKRNAPPAPGRVVEKGSSRRGHLAPKPGMGVIGLADTGAPRALFQGLPRPGLGAAVVPETLYRSLEFDPSGPGETRTFLATPIDGGVAKQAARLAKKETNDRLENLSLPVGPGAVNRPDAFRHALWIYKITKHAGADAAKRFGDAHERSVVNKPGERLMDLYNNDIGRRLAQDPRNLERSDEDVIMGALRKGWLRVTPFKVSQPSSQ